MTAPVSVSTSSTELVPADPEAQVLILQNMSDTDVIVAMGLEASTGGGLVMPANDPSWKIIEGPMARQPWSAIHAGTGTKIVRIERSSFKF